MKSGGIVAYIKKTVQAGKTCEMKYYYASRLGIHTPRTEHKNLTCEAVQKINIKMAAEKLTHTMNCNFIENDIYVTYTYAKNYRPANEEEAKEVLSKNLRKMRREYKKAGLKLKYVVTTEIGKKGAVHHHMVLNHIDFKIIKKIWCHGALHIQMLDSTGNYSKVAEYLIKINAKKVKYGNAYSTSRNLEKPKIEKEVIHSCKWRDRPPKAPAGYYLEKESYYNGISDYNGQPILFCRFIQGFGVNKNNDLYVILTYKNKYMPSTEAEAKNNVNNFLKAVKKEYKSEGKKTNCVAICDRKNKTSFSHVLKLSVIDVAILKKVWTYGNVVIKKLSDSEIMRE